MSGILIYVKDTKCSLLRRNCSLSYIAYTIKTNDEEDCYRISRKKVLGNIIPDNNFFRNMQGRTHGFQVIEEFTAGS